MRFLQFVPINYVETCHLFWEIHPEPCSILMVVKLIRQVHETNEMASRLT